VVLSSSLLATDSLAGFEYGLVKCRGEREGSFFRVFEIKSCFSLAFKLLDHLATQFSLLRSLSLSFKASHEMPDEWRRHVCQKNTLSLTLPSHALLLG